MKVHLSKNLLIKHKTLDFNIKIVDYYIKMDDFNIKIGDYWFKIVDFNIKIKFIYLSCWIFYTTFKRLQIFLFSSKLVNFDIIAKFLSQQLEPENGKNE